MRGAGTLLRAALPAPPFRLALILRKVKHGPVRPPNAIARRIPQIRWRKLARITLIALGAACLLLCLSLFLLKWIDPPTTAVQIQRRVESWFAPGTYQKRYAFVPLGRISPHLAHAVIAAEDSRFFEHHGFDWIEIKDAVTDDWEEGRIRGASTISQQAVKNLYLTTRGGLIRKALELPMTVLAEAVLGKQRILELYLNISEMGRGVYGAEAAAMFYFRVHAASLNREQSSRLASILPSPRRRSPLRNSGYAETILARMKQMGW